MKVAIIGGGPAGLTTLRFLAKAHEFFPIPPLEVRLFEAEEKIGGTFVYRVYEDAELVSSKYLTAFSDFRLPKDAPDFVKPADYVRYLNDYVDSFGLRGLIECQTKVEQVSRGPGGVGHILRIKNSGGEAFNYECDAVAICSGIHVTPNLPNIPGLARIPKVLHSSQLKSREQFGKSTNVIVCGAGETGMDIAHLAVTSPTASVTLCHRDGFFCAPKIIPTPVHGKQKLPERPNKPVDTSVASLFDTAYAHPVLQRSQLLWATYDQTIKKLHILVSGTEEGPDQWVGHISKERKNLDSSHRSTSWWNRMRTSILNVPIKDTKGRRIDVRKWPLAVDEQGWVQIPEDKADGVNSGKPIKADVIVLATGYSTDFWFLDADYPQLGHTNARGVYKEGDVSVGFIGFVRPAIGAIPPLAELQAQLWVYRLLQHQFPDKVSQGPGPNALTSYELDYKLHARCDYDFFSTKRGVDHEAYAYQLALDMGSAPNITYVMSKGWKLFFTWAMGSNFNPKFRLVGPWKWEAGAERIMRGELYDVVKRSGGFLYLLTYSIIPFMVFGALSVMLYSLSALVDTLTAPIRQLKSARACGKKVRQE